MRDKRRKDKYFLIAIVNLEGKLGENEEYVTYGLTPNKEWKIFRQNAANIYDKSLIKKSNTVFLLYQRYDATS
jgi:hypothetical protein